MIWVLVCNFQGTVFSKAGYSDEKFLVVGNRVYCSIDTEKWEEIENFSDVRLYGLYLI